MAKKKDQNRVVPAAIETRGTPSYYVGRKAYRDRRSVSSNPYPTSQGSENGSQRTSWFNGWYDLWRQTKYGPNEDEIVLREPDEI